ncbi:hypothetical protein [Saccharopolyspora hattusasensis]|uniref:hypothetical protein n=1 Tax=Saccharopolyspora hattusasensis TaxID=1128679 RepID=UPI003D98287F
MGRPHGFEGLGLMNMRKAASGRVARAAGMIGAFSVAITLATTGLAQAATPGNLKVCTGKNFYVTVKLPGRGGLSVTPAKFPNKVSCATTHLGGKTNERVDVFAGDRYMGSFIYNGQRGAEVHGIPGPSFYVS